MNKVPEPIFNDGAILMEILTSQYFRNYASELAQVQNAYQAYVNSRGNGLLLTPIVFTDAFREKFRNLYKSRRGSFSYVKRLREATDIASCPMCGSYDVGTLDHLLPKNDFCEFAIFSRNLVPACHGCNVGRGQTYSQNGARVLHPYFDNFLTNRTIYTELHPTNNNYVRPRLNIGLIDPHHPHRRDIEFHIRTVILKTTIFTKQQQIWGKIQNRPKTHLTLRGIAVTRTTLPHILRNAIERFDDEFENPNNWKSMLIHGILIDTNVQQYLIRNWHSIGVI